MYFKKKSMVTVFEKKKSLSYKIYYDKLQMLMEMYQNFWF